MMAIFVGSIKIHAASAGLSTREGWQSDRTATLKDGRSYPERGDERESEGGKNKGRTGRDLMH